MLYEFSLSTLKKTSESHDTVMEAVAVTVSKVSCLGLVA